VRLTRYTDYALRVLMYLGARDDRLCSIREIAQAYGISENHLMKVVQDLGRLGFVTTVRGRGGGLRLARPAEEIRVGAVVRKTETDMDLADCGSCVLVGLCGLTGALNAALRAFLDTLDRYTLADVIGDRALLRPVLMRELAS
jgi:Rrf2 family nitric oxide-sensitive transcriptional repressor